ncbi:Uncharacterized protein RNJ44_03704 [Nakaseomyces bracarensis]|uniref:NADH-cytochrome b5 reductase n=1 Tax=Nakaseomyces bracarensis TaxID=273131 RepID=A0ABR4NXW5_9SACH
MSDDIIEHKNILDEPLHGLYIPAGLFVAGIAIMTYLSGEPKILLALLVLGMLIGVRFFAAFQRRRSLYPDKWTSLELEDQTLISKNTAIYRFKLKTPLETVEIPSGHHVQVRVYIDGKEEIRNYNPISSRYERGHLDLLVKSYKDGRVSKHFASMKPGETVDFRGPVGSLVYKPNTYKNIGMVCGGSGITPALQMLNDIITVPEDLTKLSLIYCNVTENDILLKDELDDMAEKYPHFDVHYIISQGSETWDGDVGHISKEYMEKFLPSPSDDSRLLICGPEGFSENVFKYAKELGWKMDFAKSKGDEHVFVF